MDQEVVIGQHLEPPFTEDRDEGEDDDGDGEREGGGEEERGERGWEGKRKIDRGGKRQNPFLLSSFFRDCKAEAKNPQRFPPSGQEKSPAVKL